MVVAEVNKLMEDLERQELEAPEGIATLEVYQKLLALYLCQNDLCNAKYLWKRIPEAIKTSSEELGRIWNVGQSLWKRDLSNTYAILHTTTWSPQVSDIMKMLEENVRQRAVDLVSRAYSSISIDALAAMTGLNPETAAKAAIEKGWTFEADTRFVRPIRDSNNSSAPFSSEDQLGKLTDFVSYLEN